MVKLDSFCSFSISVFIIGELLCLYRSGRCYSTLSSIFLKPWQHQILLLSDLPLPLRERRAVGTSLPSSTCFLLTLLYQLKISHKTCRSRKNILTQLLTHLIPSFNTFYWLSTTFQAPSQMLSARGRGKGQTVPVLREPQRRGFTLYNNHTINICSQMTFPLPQASLLTHPQLLLHLQEPTAHAHPTWR